MKIRTVIAVIIAAVWAINYTVAVFNTTYHPPLEINAVMLLMAGYFFGSGLRKGTQEP